MGFVKGSWPIKGKGGNSIPQLTLGLVPVLDLGGWLLGCDPTSVRLHGDPLGFVPLFFFNSKGFPRAPTPRGPGTPEAPLKLSTKCVWVVVQ